MRDICCCGAPGRPQMLARSASGPNKLEGFTARNPGTATAEAAAGSAIAARKRAAAEDKAAAARLWLWLRIWLLLRVISRGWA